MTLSEGRYTKSYTPYIVGTYNFSFYCLDYYDNTASNESTNLTFTSSTRPSATAPGGGGGYPPEPTCPEGEIMIGGKCVNATQMKMELQASPSRVDRIFIPLFLFVKKQDQYREVIKANKELADCEVTSGDFSCEVVGTTAIVTLNVTDTNFFSKVFEGEVRLEDKLRLTNYVPVRITTYNPAYSIPLTPVKIGKVFNFAQYFINESQGFLIGIRWFGIIILLSGTLIIVFKRKNFTLKGIKKWLKVKKGKIYK